MRVIAVSASYGAGGSVIAPLVAERLGVAYLDRAVAARDSQRMEEEVREAAVSEEELERGLWQRIISALAATPSELSPVTETVEHPDRTVRREAEARLHAFASSGAGGVVLGWAASAVLPEAYRVRLDGPAERRLLQGMEIEDLDEDTARRRLEKTDEVRALYWRRLYQRDWRDPALFHLFIDSTALDLDTVADLIVRAATAASTR
ncbi:MAG TPA: cytidylate kinase-like family protein [Acidimicrobiales bacterium]|nr:cytidylate kinase-like family protein [Acidimicrobiales bacterium]